MKLILALAAVAWVQADRLDRGYIPPNPRPSAEHGDFLKTPHHVYNGAQTRTHSKAPLASINKAQNAYTSYEARPERAQASRERNAAILRQDYSNDGETYSYAYETENGIFGEQRGVATNGIQAQGSYSYTGDDGKVYSIRYTADENGFVAQGDHLPTPHPIPEAILKALEQNARDEAAGIFDDGSYNEVKYSGKSPQTKPQQQYYKTNAQSINNNRKSATVESEYLPPLRQRNQRRNRY